MTEWIAIGLTAAAMLAGFAVMWGEMKAERKATKETMEQHTKWHGEHFDHAKDHDAHWTGRERGDLGKKLDTHERKLDAISDKIDSLASRMYGDSK